MPTDATAHHDNMPCAALQELAGRVSNLERWEKAQNGMLGELKELLADSVKERKSQFEGLSKKIDDNHTEAAERHERLGTKMEANRKEAAERLDKLLYWLIAFTAGAALAVALAFGNHVGQP